jgi:exoribonuclease R
MRPRIATTDGARLAPAFAAIRAAAGVPEAFPPDILAAADRAARSPRLPDHDLTAIPFVTLDPPTSMDLDQAFHLEPLPGGMHRVRYAIADVAAFVAPDDPVASEAMRRVTTVYCPDRRIPLYPTSLSEAAASLLPDGPRPAVVWTIDIDEAGATTAIDVRLALVRSRAKLGHQEAQDAIDRGAAEPPLSHLRAVGETLLAAERARGGMSLRVPEQEVGTGADGRLELRFRRSLPVEDWNAQLSLLTGRAAAALMLTAGVGLLRTMPAAEARDVQRLRRVARGLGIDWPDQLPYGALVTTLEADTPARAAFLNEAGTLFRGAGYTAFDGAAPTLTTHAAIAAPYAHCTAPLRRLADRTVSEVCLAIAAGRPVAEETRAALPLLPAAMAEGTRRAGHVERGCIDTVEAAVLQPHLGESFTATVVGVDDDGDGGEIVLPDLAVVARCAGRLPLGRTVDVVLEAAEIVTGRVRFRMATQEGHR